MELSECELYRYVKWIKEIFSRHLELVAYLCLRKLGILLSVIWASTHTTEATSNQNKNSEKSAPEKEILIRDINIIQMSMSRLIKKDL